jgi:hypothetical protein
VSVWILAPVRLTLFPGVAVVDLAHMGERATSLAYFVPNTEDEALIVPIKTEILYDPALDPLYK